MKTKPATKTSRAISRLKAAADAIETGAAPPPVEPELDLEPWTVTRSEKKTFGLGREVKTFTFRLKYRGRTLMSVNGLGGEAGLTQLAARYNAARCTPVLHAKAYADLTESSRAHIATKRSNQDNLMKPFIEPHYT